MRSIGAGWAWGLVMVSAATGGEVGFLEDFALALLALAVWPFLGSILTISISPQPSTQILRTANGTTPSGR